ncbi:integrase catalytic subunit [Pseudomonas aeruginosa VRFPA02]|nr:integrase catalytic subunit [Pseudomonas aeruginosa VRFPA02]
MHRGPRRRPRRPAGRSPAPARPAVRRRALYKTEVIHRRAPWRTKAAVELATLEWVSWFNHQRLLASIGDIPPAEAEERYYRQLAAPAAEPVLL